MSSAVVSPSAALGRPFVFDVKAVPEVSLPAEPTEGRPPQRVRPGLSGATADPRLAHVTPASQLDIRPAPEMVSSGIPAIDTLTGGLPRGCLTEIYGPASSGRTTLLLAALAAATRRAEFCALIDASDALDPQSAAAAGVELDRLLWVRCCGDHAPQKPRMKQNGCPISRASFVREACPELVERVGLSSQAPFKFDLTNRQSEHCLEQVLRATDLLLESGGFGLIVLDLGDLPTQAARRIPLTTWFRFRRAVENKPTILLAIEQRPIAGSCSSLLVQLGSADEMAAERLAPERRKNAAHGASRGVTARDAEAPEGRKKNNLPAQPELDFPCPPHAQLFTGLDINAELIRSRLDRKPARSVMFETKTAWAG
jgi:recombination protein RecA